MFGVDKKGNYGPLSLHDYSDDSDGENDFVSEQIRNQRAAVDWISDVDIAKQAENFVSVCARTVQTVAEKCYQQLKQQDEGLDMLSKSADRLGALSLGISEELGHQNKMLDEMENDLDKTTQRLDFVTQKTKEMIKRSGGKQNFLIIVALIVVAFILILLILYT